MTRQEFGSLLTMAKHNANVKLADSLPFIRRLSPKKMEAIENGTFNYNLSDAFLYLNMCGATLDIFWDNIGSIKELREKLQKEIKNWDMTSADIAKRSGISVSVINAFLEGHACLKIDTFLKIMNALGEEITIQ